MKITVLKDQIILAKQKTDQLISAISDEKWATTPEVLNTNLNWQIGHIILANYLHGIASITGANAEVRNNLNVPDFVKFYGPNSKPADFENEKPSREELLKVYELTFSIILKGMDNLAEKELDNTTEVPNPGAKTKYEALMWLAQHQSWHNGQIAVLKRVLG